MTIYSATKAFTKYLCLATSREYQRAGKDTDLLCLQPGSVSTKMIDELVQEGRALAMVTVEECESSALRDLGYDTSTCGAAKHQFVGHMMTLLRKYATFQDEKISREDQEFQ